MAKEEKQPEKIKAPKPTHTAAVPFRDANDFNKVYEAGADVSHLENIENLVALGHVSKAE